LLTRLLLGLTESEGETGTALAAFGFIHKGWIKAGQVLRTGSGLAKDFQLLELGYLVIQTTGAIELVPDVAGIFVILQEHVVQFGHRRFSFLWTQKRRLCRGDGVAWGLGYWMVRLARGQREGRLGITNGNLAISGIYGIPCIHLITEPLCQQVWVEYLLNNKITNLGCYRDVTITA